jgi:predicted ATPase
MGLRPESGRSQQDLIVQALSMQTCLVVLDNCEHVLAEASVLAEQMLRTCPSVQLLTTSRQPLGLPDEHVIQVPPLGAARRWASCARAGRALADDSESELVDELCRRLDGYHWRSNWPAAGGGLLS